jgi:hypothetical protein
MCLYHERNELWAAGRPGGPVAGKGRFICTRWEGLQFIWSPPEEANTVNSTEPELTRTLRDGKATVRSSEDEVQLLVTAAQPNSF